MKSDEMKQQSPAAINEKKIVNHFESRPLATILNNGKHCEASLTDVNHYQPISTVISGSMVHHYCNIISINMISFSSEQ